MRWLLRRLNIHPNAYYNYLLKTKAEYYDSREEIFREIKNIYHEYDAYGNRASLTENGNTVTYLYDEANQLLSASYGLSFKYDRRGNVIERSLKGEVLNTYIYGANNRLERAENSKGGTATYKYNGLGRRVSRRADNTEIDYILDQTKMYNNLLEADGEEYIWDENNLLFRNEEAQIRDRLGSPVGEDEFGMASAPGTLGFTGYMYDDISGTYFAQAREYMPEAGRFAGRDIVKGSILQPLTLNNYNYCYSNPNKYVDWDGRIPELISEAYNIYRILSSKNGGTYSTGVTIGGGCVTAGGAVSIGIIIDSKGNIAVATSVSYRAGSTGIGASVAKYNSWTNANSVKYVEGWSDIDGEVSFISPIPQSPVAGGAEYTRFTGKDGTKNHGFTINRGIGVSMPTGGMPVSIAAGQTRTWVKTIGQVKDGRKESLD